MILQGLYTVSLIEGDGIGPEIAQSVKDIFKAANVCFAPSILPWEGTNIAL
jgi:isocitrate/isopropylmalate dehydrogenase